ncbi:hypothetical protein GSY74_02620 [Sulfurovum sp. bin170]|uniref:hypothetical protein n=1 Tax=Sulfurovum sp. bin170 TaxID=2695268 RepID=UPI0013DE9971|nr:hypothetical protein [Sulfurovum sp. bin170]NEW60166.1 hypothetical protein [Sulfurovum sp. bin170]
MQKFLMIMVSLLFIFNISNAETIEVKYKVEFGIFGEIGIAEAKLTKDDSFYVIDIDLEATGIAKTLSRGQKERHISKGHIADGVMVSDLYQIIKHYGSKMTDRVYKIDHDKKEVIRVTQKWKRGEMYKDETKVMKEYAKDDLLTLYFNLNSYVKDRTTSKDYRFEAVGAEKQDGFVDVHIPNSDELPEFKKMLGEDADWYARAVIHQEIFSSDKGELLLSIGKDGIAQKAVLKDLIFFGDIRAFRL